MKKFEKPVVLNASEVAKAGEILKQLNSGAQEIDLAACGKVADALEKIRKREIFRQLDGVRQAHIREAAKVVNPRFGRNDDMLLNFLSEAFGAVKRPTKAEPQRRDRIGTFLEAYGAIGA